MWVRIPPDVIMVEKIDFQSLLDIAQSWAFPAMYEDLSHHLGVSVDSLRRLGIGYLPCVPPDGLPHPEYGRWIIPERDADGNVIGLGTRLVPAMCHPGIKKNKSTYKGSKRGLIYEFNGVGGNGGAAFTAGPHNWVRAMDAGCLCQVCGKPDGCLLSSENPNDPKAVVCIRQESPRRLKFGWLHIRKAEGLQVSGRILSVGEGQKDKPVIHVEGMTDVAAAMDLGYPAVGRPNNIGGMDLLSDLCRGLPGLVVGENDEAGQEGLNVTFSALKKVSKDVRHCYPPEQFKDLRAWKNKTGLLAADFARYIEVQSQNTLDSGVLEDDRPGTVAKSYLRLPQNQYKGKNRLRYWGENWYKYEADQGRFVKLSDAELTEPLYQWIHNTPVISIAPDSPPKQTMLKETRTLMQSIEGFMTSEVLCRASNLPVWVATPSVGWNNPLDVISFKNGLLHVPLFVGGADKEHYWREPTADMFTITGMPIVFDPEAICPIWTAFLDSSLGDDLTKILLLQEWFGYCMVPDRSMDKLMYLMGVSGSGKGTILTALRYLVGEHQVVTTDLSNLSSHFGLAGWVGKLVATIEDARTPRSADMMRGLERLLNITGGDSVRVERKNREALESVQLNARLTIASNEWLVVPDHAQALPRRTNIITFNRSFVGREDHALKDQKVKDTKELQGIALWALKGLIRLRQQGRFTVPTSSGAALDQWMLSLSPMLAFIHETCELHTDHWISKVQLFDAWDKWSVERGQTRCMKNQFYTRFTSNATCATHEIRSGQDGFRGVYLQKWARRSYLGEP